MELKLSNTTDIASSNNRTGYGFWWENDGIQLTAKFHFHHVTKLMYDFERIIMLTRI